MSTCSSGYYAGSGDNTEQDKHGPYPHTVHSAVRAIHYEGISIKFDDNYNESSIGHQGTTCQWPGRRECPGAPRANGRNGSGCTGRSGEGERATIRGPSLCYENSPKARRADRGQATCPQHLGRGTPNPVISTSLLESPPLSYLSASGLSAGLVWS